MKHKEAAIYQFVGPGEGIPGLPHRVTMSEATRLGLADVLAEAIDKGLYEEAK